MSASERQAKIRIVLVNTSHPGNIGGAARAMKNMGLAELYLVEPREYPAPRAVWRAAGARDVLANAKIVGSVDEAIKDCGLVIGTSARERRIPWPLINPRECGIKFGKRLSLIKLRCSLGEKIVGSQIVSYKSAIITCTFRQTQIIAL